MNENNIQTITENKKKGNGLLIAIIVILIIIFIIMGYFLFTFNKKINDLQNDNKELKEQIKETTTREEDNTINNIIQKTDDEIVKELYIEELKKTKSQCKITDYKIDKVKVLTENERQQLINSISDYKTASDKDIFAEVTFSEKLENVNEPSCLAGNGELKDEWLINVVRVLYIKYENGNYNIVSSGTGW